MLSVALAAVVSLHAQRPSYRSAIDLVILNVTVIGPDGRYIADLSGDDFQVLEDGRPQDVAYFSPANVPLSVSLVLDTSSSMDEQMPGRNRRRWILLHDSDRVTLRKLSALTAASRSCNR